MVSDINDTEGREGKEGICLPMGPWELAAVENRMSDHQSAPGNFNIPIFYRNIYTVMNIVTQELILLPLQSIAKFPEISTSAEERL